MKQFLFFSILLLSLQGFAQIDFMNSNNVRTMTATDNEGRTLLKSKYAPDIEGTPFLQDEWANAGLILNGGRVIKSVRVKINLESNELYFLDSASTVLVANEGLVDEVRFVFPDEKEGSANIFKCGYPAIDQQKTSFYYKVICEGKINFLKKIWKEVEVTKNDMSGEVKKQFVEYASNYVYCNGTMFQYRSDKDLLLRQMADKKALVESFLSSNKISFKKIADVEKLVKYYNSLK